LALLPQSFERSGPKSVSPPMNCSGVEVVVSLKWIVAMRASPPLPEKTLAQLFTVAVCADPSSLRGLPRSWLNDELCTRAIWSGDSAREFSGAKVYAISRSP
jgi:hypothetical protein